MTLIRDALPKGWTTASIADLCSLDIDQSGPQGPSKFTYIDISSIDRLQKRVLDAKLLSPSDAPSRARQRVQLGDVLVSMTRPNLNAVAEVVEHLDGAVASTGFCVLRPAAVESKWLYHAVQHHHFVDAMSSVVQGALYPAVRPKDILSYELSVPPLAEQRRIVATLEEHLSELDAAVAGLERARANASRVRQATRDCALARYPTVPLGNVLAEPLANGRSVPTAEKGFPVLRLTSLRSGHIDQTQFKIGAWDASTARPFLIQSGDFLISRGNGSRKLVGRGGLVGEVGRAVAYPDTLIRARAEMSKLLPVYLRIAWDSQLVRGQIERAARTTAGIYKINQRDIERVELPLPPSTIEQERVASAIDEKLNAIDRGILDIDSQLFRASRLRQAILRHAFEGKLVPQDPNDEPASDLLDRIRTEREHEKRSPSVKARTKSRPPSRAPKK